ncbi:GSCOCG00011337001-RA-CDS, partial [Cotesia congregata]
MITASHFGLICRKKPQTSCAGIVKQILYSRSLGNVDSVNYGKDNEKQALKDLAVKLGINHDRIKPCGLFIDQHIEYLGATSDGIIDDDYIVEIKCLASIRHLSPDEALKIDNKNIKTIFNKNKTSLNKNHHYYYQVQGQLHITNKKYCYFTIWIPYGVKYNLVEKDDDFWKTSMENYLTQFYTECVLPEIIDSRFTRNMPIREPTFILEAQKKAANLKKEKEDKENEKRKKKKNTDKEISTKKITIISNEITIQRSNDDCKRKVAINSWITIPNSDKIFTDEEILKAIEIIDNLRVNISLSNVISNISSSDSLLNDESIEYFLQILDQNSDNYTHPVLYYSYPHLIVPSKTKRDLQIIGGNQNRHWRCIRFDGTNLFVYDSLSLPLSTEDYDYIRKRFPQVKPNNITFIEVTHQSDT